MFFLRALAATDGKFFASPGANCVTGNQSVSPSALFVGAVARLRSQATTGTDQDLFKQAQDGSA